MQKRPVQFEVGDIITDHGGTKLIIGSRGDNLMPTSLLPPRLSFTCYTVDRARKSHQHFFPNLPYRWEGNSLELLENAKDLNTERREIFRRWTLVRDRILPKGGEE